MSRLVKPISVTVAVLAAIALAGCAGEEAAAPPETSKGITKNKPSQALEADVTAAEVSPTECIVGQWVADNDQLAAALATLAEAEGGAVESVTGDATLTIAADGQTDTAYTNWHVTMLQEGMTVELIRNGTDHGTYTVTGDNAITMLATSSDSKIQMRMNGADTGTVPTTNTLPLTKAAFTCDGSQLTVDTVDGVIAFNRK